MRSVKLLGLSIISQSKADVLSELKNHFKTGKTNWLIATPNPEQIMLSRRDEEFDYYLKQMKYLMPDGVGVVWASRFLNKPEDQIKERVTGLDLVPRLVDMAKGNNRPVLIVGGREYEGKTIDLYDLKVLIRSTESLKNGGLGKGKNQKQFGVWWSQGYEEVGAPSREEEKWLDEVMARLKPIVIFIALGAPHQEKWLISRRALLSAHAVRIGLTVGGAFDVLTGQLPRAPQSWQNLGLEWLWRLIQEPHRWRRQLALIKFVGLVLKTKLFS